MKLFSKKIPLLVGLMMSATVAEATPAFARQMDTSCITCHAQNIPKLNSFGREFKLSGFTMTGTKDIQDTTNGGIALPSTLNIGFVIKARMLSKTDSAGESTMHTEIFDEAAFIFGGKIADNVGTSMEFIEGLMGGKITFTDTFGFGRLGATMFMTDALGAFSGTEIYTTGLYRPIRQFENRKKANIFQRLDIGSGAATGMQAYYSGHGLYATVGQYSPAFGASIDTTDGYKTLVRVAYETNIAGFTTAVGAYSLGGNVIANGMTVAGKVAEVNADSFDRKSTGLDLQVEGDIEAMPMMLTVGFILSNTYTSGGVIGGVQEDKTGFSTAFQLNPIERLGVKVAYLSYTDNNYATNGESSFSLGTDYSYRQNIRFCLEYSMTGYKADGKDNSTDILFMTMAAF